MNLAAFVQPGLPVAKYADRPGSRYWRKDATIYYGSKVIKGADAETFRCFFGGYGIDKKACYFAVTQLRGADPATFQVLNFTYAKDQGNVWALGIRIPDADPLSFEVCDDGAYQYPNSDQLCWYGYAKDDQAVYYYDFDGKPTRLKKADPASFVSLGDKIFAKDANHVFLGAAVIPKASPATWEFLGGVYSRDAKRVFWRKVALPGVEPTKFAALAEGQAKNSAGGDGTHWYYCDLAITGDEYNRLASGELDSGVLWERMNRRNAGSD